MHLPIPILVLLLVLLVLLHPAHGRQSLADKLFLDFLPPNNASMSIINGAIFTAETPVVIRFTLMGGIAIYEPRAACHPTALSFFATRDAIPPALCREPTLSILVSYTTHRALREEFPAEAASYAAFLRRLGLEPESSSTDPRTLNGWANIAGARIARFFRRDGWNSLGDANGSPFRLPFQDTTRYKPVNDPYTLQRPLRWQPIVQEQDGRGRFLLQVHSVPHIGITGHPLVLSFADYQSRVAKGPFHAPDRRKQPSEGDRRKAKRLLSRVIYESQRLNARRRFFARWWNNKLLSTSAISSFYEKAARLNKFEIAQQFLGEMLAQHDAILIAWREKRRNDLARPRTLMRTVLRGKSFEAFVNERVGVRRVRAEDWQPLVQEQPHSEFPSASATICTAAMEHIETYVAKRRGRVPAIDFTLPPRSLPFTDAGRRVRFDSPAHAARICARSRLWAGVHLKPAIDAGERLGRGIGVQAFLHVRELGRGRVPDGCLRCGIFRE